MKDRPNLGVLKRKNINPCQHFSLKEAAEGFLDESDNLRDIFSGLSHRRSVSCSMRGTWRHRELAAEPGIVSVVLPRKYAQYKTHGVREAYTKAPEKIWEARQCAIGTRNDVV